MDKKGVKKSSKARSKDLAVIDDKVVDSKNFETSSKSSEVVEEKIKGGKAVTKKDGKDMEAAKSESREIKLKDGSHIKRSDDERIALASSNVERSENQEFTEGDTKIKIKKDSKMSKADSQMEKHSVEEKTINGANIKTTSKESSKMESSSHVTSSVVKSSSSSGGPALTFDTDLGLKSASNNRTFIADENSASFSEHSTTGHHSTSFTDRNQVTSTTVLDGSSDMASKLTSNTNVLSSNANMLSSNTNLFSTNENISSSNSNVVSSNMSTSNTKTKDMELNKNKSVNSKTKTYEQSEISTSENLSTETIDQKEIKKNKRISVTHGKYTGPIETIYKKKIFDQKTGKWKVVDEKIIKNQNKTEKTDMGNFSNIIDDVTNVTTTTYTTKMFDSKDGKWKVVDEKSFVDEKVALPTDIVVELEKDKTDVANITTTTEILKVGFLFQFNVGANFVGGIVSKFDDFVADYKPK